MPEKLSKQKKRSYLIYIILVFILGVIIDMVIYPQNAGKVAVQYSIALVIFLAILSFIYFLLKMVFHSQAKSEKDELHLEELPYDKDDINNRH